MAGRLRLFLGLPLPPSYQEGLARLAGGFSGPSRLPGAARLAWTRPGNWHLTLKFLGGVAPDRARAVIEASAAALAALPFRPFRLGAGGAGAFPSLARPRVLWAGVVLGAAECAALAARLDAALEPLGVARETRPFRPHLTLARVRDDGGDAVAEVLEQARTTAWPVVTVRDVALWRSETGADGPVYTPLAVFAAADGGDDGTDGGAEG